MDGLDAQSPEERVATMRAAVEADRAEAERLANLPHPIEGSFTDDPERYRDLINEHRSQLDDQHERLAASANALEAELKSQMEQMRQEMEHQMRRLKAELKPLQKKAEDMMHAVQGISLYLGSTEQLTLLRDGEPAAADSQIVVYSSSLFMDEEIALAAERLGLTGGVLNPGPKGWETFSQWLLESDDHIDQLCPSNRGIVLLHSARENRSEIPFASDGSSVPHLLVRNGDLVAWVNVGKDFGIGKRLVPAQSEISDTFTGSDGEPLQPGSFQWESAAAKADANRKHYMKVALILQGLLDRTTLLAPLPADDLSFITPDAYDAGHIRVVTGDNALPTGMPHYSNWVDQIQNEADVGQRVVVGNISSYGDESPIHPRYASSPPTGTALQLKRVKGQLKITYPRTDNVFKRDHPIPDRPGWTQTGYFPASSPASCRLDQGTRDWLPIDNPAVTPEIIEFYLSERESRKYFINMLPLMRSALAVLKEEATTEAPFKQLLTTSISKQYRDVEEERVAEVVDHAVFWWKTKKRNHRALISATGDDKQAFDEIIGHVTNRFELEARPINDQLVESLASDQKYMWVGRKTDGNYVALEAANDKFVHIHEWTAARGKPRPVQEWKTAPDTRSWQTLHETDQHKTWPRYIYTNNHLTDPEIDGVVARLRENHPDACNINVTNYHNLERQFFNVQTPGERAFYDEDCPLTGNCERSSYSEYEYRWTKTGGVIDLSQRSRVGTVTYGRYKHFSTLWHDEKKFKALEAEEERVLAEREAIIAPMRNLSRSTRIQLIEAWEQAAIEDEYRKFVVQYGSQSKGRWEGHKKAIQQTRLNFPHPIHTLNNLLGFAAEQGVLVDGEPITLAQIIERTDFEDGLNEDMAEALDGITATPTSKDDH